MTSWKRERARERERVHDFLEEREMGEREREREFTTSWKRERERGFTTSWKSGTF